MAQFAIKFDHPIKSFNTTPWANRELLLGDLIPWRWNLVDKKTQSKYRRGVG